MATTSTKKQTKKLGDYGDELEKKYGSPGEVITGTGGPADRKLPAQYYARAEEERKYKLKQQYLKGLAQTTFQPGSNVQLSYTPDASEINHQVSLDNEDQYYAFSQWMASKFDTRDPVQAQLLYDMHPNFFDARMAQVDKNLAIQRKVAEIQNRGPTTEEDLMFMWQAARGDIFIPHKPAFMTDEPLDEQVKARRYGALNWRKINRPNPAIWDNNGWVNNVPVRRGKIYSGQVNAPVGGQGDAPRFARVLAERRAAFGNN